MKVLAVFVLALVIAVNVEAAVQPSLVPIYRVSKNAATTEATTTVTTETTTAVTTETTTEATAAPNKLSAILEARQSRHPRSLGTPRAAEGFTYEHVCTGTLVDDSAVITTVTCIELATDGNLYNAVVGTAAETSSVDVTGKVFYEVSKITKHPNYNVDTNVNNVAVLKLTPEVDYTLSSKVSYITWSLAVPAAETKCVASYWAVDAPFAQVNKDVTVKACATPASGAICSDYATPPATCPSGANGGSLVCDSKLAGVFTARRNADCSAALWQYQELSKDAEWIWKSVSAAPILNVSFAAILALVTAMLKSL